MAKDDPTYHDLVELRRARKRRDHEVLIEALDNHVEAPRAARYLSAIGAHQAVPKLREMLATTDASVRNAAVVALGNLHARDAASDVSRIAHADPVQWVRSYALIALQRILGPESRQALLTALREDPDWRTRRAAALALGKAGVGDDLPQLAAAATREPWWRRREYRKADRRIRRRERRSI